MQTPNDLPSFSIMRCFEAAAKNQSFTAAADELGLTQGAVSRQVKDLEEQLGLALFTRAGRGVRLTRAGEALATNLARDLSKLRNTILQAVSAGQAQELLSIAVPPTFASRWMIPRLRDFTKAYPNLETMLISHSEPFDLQQRSVDLAIHFGHDDWPGAQLTPLCPENLVVVASPELIRSNPQNRQADILNLPLLHISSRPHLWSQFQTSLGLDGPNTRRGSYFDQFSLVISAAIHALGAAILPTYLIENELASGALLPLAPVADQSGQNYYMVTPLGERSAKTQAFMRWLKANVKNRPA
ncbi:LysR family transcriptional regulator [Cognatishimia sp. WU-CL00825]|uniref:LysR substrate-binding domain-containing protein n=1 Tax=Cognatishimia sp. WU-CL00825 TaxID=3127658 RepID=UPI003103AB8A